MASCWGFKNSVIVSFAEGKTPHKKDLWVCIKLHLMVRLQIWKFAECGVPIHLPKIHWLKGRISMVRIEMSNHLQIVNIYVKL